MANGKKLTALTQLLFILISSTPLGKRIKPNQPHICIVIINKQYFNTGGILLENQKNLIS